MARFMGSLVKALFLGDLGQHLLGEEARISIVDRVIFGSAR